MRSPIGIGGNWENIKWSAPLGPWGIFPSEVFPFSNPSTPTGKKWRKRREKGTFYTFTFSLKS
jgi:hypothetical protein